MSTTLQSRHGCHTSAARLPATITANAARATEASRKARDTRRVPPPCIHGELRTGHAQAATANAFDGPAHLLGVGVGIGIGIVIDTIQMPKTVSSIPIPIPTPTPNTHQTWQG